VITDNSDNDLNGKYIKRIADPRVIYQKNEFNIGVNRNVIKSITLSKGEYVVLCSDEDDVEIEGLFKLIHLMKLNDCSLGLGKVKMQDGKFRDLRFGIFDSGYKTIKLIGFRHWYMAGIVYHKSQINMDVINHELDKKNLGFLNTFPHSAIAHSLMLTRKTISINEVVAITRDQATHNFSEMDVGFDSHWTLPNSTVGQFISDLQLIETYRKYLNNMEPQFLALSRYRFCFSVLLRFYLDSPDYSDYFGIDYKKVKSSETINFNKKEMDSALNDFLNKGSYPFSKLTLILSKIQILIGFGAYFYHKTGLNRFYLKSLLRKLNS
jgi:hypothetical protein